MKLKIGNIKHQQKDMRGWLVGQFFDKKSSFRDENVEIYCKVLNKKEFEDKLHYHPIGMEYLFVLKGNIKIQIGEKTYELNENDYVSMKANTNDKIVDFSQGTTIFGVRYPSIPNNKVFLE